MQPSLFRATPLLAAAVGCDDGDAVGIKHMVGLAGHALCVDGLVLAEPDLVGGVGLARLGEAAHLVEGGPVINPAAHAQRRGSNPYSVAFGRNF